MKGKLGNHTILFSAEVDGVDPAYYNTPNHNPASMRRYVELKTSRIVSNERQHRNFCRLVNKNGPKYCDKSMTCRPEFLCTKNYLTDEKFINNNHCVYIYSELPLICNSILRTLFQILIKWEKVYRWIDFYK